MPHRVTRGPKSREAAKVTLELAHAMTYIIDFLRVFVASGITCYLCLGTFEIDCCQNFLDLDVSYDLWIVIHLGLEIISSARWEWAI